MEVCFGVVRLAFAQPPINLLVFLSPLMLAARSLSLDYIASAGKRSDTSMHGCLVTEHSKYGALYLACLGYVRSCCMDILYTECSILHTQTFQLKGQHV